MKFKQEFKLLWFFYLLNFLISFVFGIISPFWVVYFQHIGLSFTQISILIMVAYIGDLFFSIPAGAFADTFGRKTSVIISFTLFIITYLGIFYTSSFFILILIYFLMSLSSCFVYPRESWFIDYLKNKGKENMIHKAVGRKKSFYSAGQIASGMIASLLALINLRLIWLWVAIGCIFLVIFVAIFGKEKFRRKHKNVKKVFKLSITTGKQGLKFSLKNKTVFILLLVVFFFFTGVGILWLGWQPRLEEQGMDVKWFGVLFSALSFLSLVLFNLSEKISKKLKHEKTMLLVFSFLFILGTVIFALVGDFAIGLIGFVIFWIGIVLGDPGSPVFIDFFNKFVPSKIRATVNSVKFFFVAIATIVASLLFGIISDSLGLRIAMSVPILFFIAVIFLYLKIKKENTFLA